MPEKGETNEYNKSKLNSGIYDDEPSGGLKTKGGLGGSITYQRGTRNNAYGVIQWSIVETFTKGLYKGETKSFDGAGGRTIDSLHGRVWERTRTYILELGLTIPGMDTEHQ